MMSLHTRFNDLLNSVVGYSLLEFLLDNKKEGLLRLHKCPDCGKFYNDRPNKKHCSEACKNRTNKAPTEKATESQQKWRRSTKGQEINETVKTFGCGKEEAVEVRKTHKEVAEYFGLSLEEAIDDAMEVWQIKKSRRVSTEEAIERMDDCRRAKL